MRGAYIAQINRLIFVNNFLILAKGRSARLSRRRRRDFRPSRGNLPLAPACALIGGKFRGGRGIRTAGPPKRFETFLSDPRLFARVAPGRGTESSNPSSSTSESNSRVNFATYEYAEWSLARSVSTIMSRSPSIAIACHISCLRHALERDLVKADLR